MSGNSLTGFYDAHVADGQSACLLPPLPQRSSVLGGGDAGIGEGQFRLRIRARTTALSARCYLGAERSCADFAPREAT